MFVIIYIASFVEMLQFSAEISIKMGENRIFLQIFIFYSLIYLGNFYWVFNKMLYEI